MTLTITAVTRDLIVQSGDFRLTDLRSGRWSDFAAHKQIAIDRKHWSALLCFSGIGHTGRVDVTSWTAQFADLPFEAELSEAIARLEDFGALLKHIRNQDRRHTFVIAGFQGVQPFASVVSNFESVVDRPRTTASARFSTTTIRPRRPRVILGGSGATSITDDDIELVRHSLDVDDPANTVRVLADLNARVGGVDSTVSTACWVSWLRSDGTGESQSFGVPEGQPFIPQYTDVLSKLGLTLKPALDENGNPKPIQLVGSSSMVQRWTPEFLQKRLAMNPDSADAWNNWGVHLQQDGKIDSAVEAYQRALVLDPEHSNANGNLGTVMSARGEHDEAERLYARSLASSPRNVVQRLNFSRFLLGVRGDRDRATLLLEEGLALDEKADLRTELERVRQLGGDDHEQT